MLPVVVGLIVDHHHLPDRAARASSPPATSSTCSSRRADVRRARHGRDLRAAARRDRPLARLLRRRRRGGHDDPRLPADQPRLGARDRRRARARPPGSASCRVSSSRACGCRRSSSRSPACSFWEGFLIWLINNQSPTNGGSIRITNRMIINIVNGTLSPTVGWIAARRRRRRSTRAVDRAARPAPPRERPGRAAARLTLLKIAAVAAAGIVLVAVCSVNRGIVRQPRCRASRGSSRSCSVPGHRVDVPARPHALRPLRLRDRRQRARRRAAPASTSSRIRVLAYTLAGFTAGGRR